MQSQKKTGIFLVNSVKGAKEFRKIGSEKKGVNVTNTSCCPLGTCDV